MKYTWPTMCAGFNFHLLFCIELLEFSYH